MFYESNFEDCLSCIHSVFCIYHYYTRIELFILLLSTHQLETLLMKTTHTYYKTHLEYQPIATCFYVPSIQPPSQLAQQYVWNYKIRFSDIPPQSNQSPSSRGSDVLISSLAGFPPHLHVSYNIGEPNETMSGKQIACDLGKRRGRRLPALVRVTSCPGLR